MSAAPYTQKEPPHAYEAERGVISSMLQGGGAVIEDVQAVIQPGAFYDPNHRKMYDLIVMAHHGGQRLDLITFTQELKNAGLLEVVGGAGEVTSVYNFTVYGGSTGMVDYYLDAVREKWIARSIIERCSAGVRRAMDESNDPQALLEEIQADIIEIGQLSKTEEALRPIGEVVPEVVESIELTYRRRGNPVGLSSGFPQLDRMTGGFQPGRTYYFAGRPAMGKSSLGVEFAEHVAIENVESQVPVAIFSVEMTRHELCEVMLCRRAKIDLRRLRDGFFSQEEREELNRQAELVKQSPVFVDEKGDLTIFEFRARARRAVVKLGAKLIIIDYIQRMRSITKKSERSRELELNEISQGISATAKELRVPIIVLAQLNRETEKRKDGVPELADLRESGSMEQEAHLVGLLYRPSYYAKTPEKMTRMAEKYKVSEEEFKQLAEVIIAKQRRGPVGPVKLRFIAKWAAFEPIDDNPLYSNDPNKRQHKPNDPEPETIPDDVREIFPGAEVIEE